MTAPVPDLAAIRTLHSPARILVHAEQCQDDSHNHDYGLVGEMLCFDCPSVGFYCEECTHDTDGELTPHPCATIRLLDTIPAPTEPTGEREELVAEFVAYVERKWSGGTGHTLNNRWVSLAELRLRADEFEKSETYRQADEACAFHPPHDGTEGGGE